MQALRVGYFLAWMEENPTADVDRAVLPMLSKLGMVPVDVDIPDWHGTLNLILFAEGLLRSRS